MIVENAESTESAITFTAHSTDSDNKVLSLEKENYFSNFVNEHKTIVMSSFQKLAV